MKTSATPSPSKDIKGQRSANKNHGGKEQVVCLQVTKVDSFGADPMSKTSPVKKGRGLHRLTTDEYNEQKDLIEMA